MYIRCIYVLYYCYIHVHVGIEVCTPDGAYQAHAILLMCATDLIARAQVTNMKQFNGKFGCLYCLQPGQTPPDNNLIRYWSYVRAYPTRTNESILEAARTAVSSNDPVSEVYHNTTIILCMFLYTCRFKELKAQVCSIFTPHFSFHGVWLWMIYTVFTLVWLIVWLNYGLIRSTEAKITTSDKRYSEYWVVCGYANTKI